MTKVTSLRTPKTYESIDGADLDKPLCNLNGKYIKYDENDYPIGCLMRFQE